MQPRSFPSSPHAEAVTGDRGARTTPERLAVVLRRYREAMHQALEAQDYRPVPPTALWFVIELARQEGTVGDLARRLEITKQAASRLADQLVALGYCDRERSETNRRQVLLRSTAEGRSAAMVLLAAIQKVDAGTLAALDADEREVFQRALAHMLG
ncbi:MarR family winged helix-turn-helix transcriptional regulator [Lentzea aerocolonigenes]|uniref:MarR family winged helix-turn-helix transcriptional regulator n=1 Tax=Lentzea aerocolonigenes TaxID=68170 RepID=UPI0004C2C8EA|nr:MarR family transcriptional regulator [Lentzea aerocolonigenes]MCP2242541.1 MarR family protein [Lentzea aerocolonigenes]